MQSENYKNSQNFVLLLAYEHMNKNLFLFY